MVVPGEYTGNAFGEIEGDARSADGIETDPPLMGGATALPPPPPDQSAAP
jgi:hypothetical protein